MGPTNNNNSTVFIEKSFEVKDAHRFLIKIFLKTQKQKKIKINE